MVLGYITMFHLFFSLSYLLISFIVVLWSSVIISNPELFRVLWFSWISFGKTLTSMLSTPIKSCRATKFLIMRPILVSWPMLIISERYIEVNTQSCIDISAMLMSLPLTCFLCPFIRFKNISTSNAALMSPWNLIFKSREHISLRVVGLIWKA